MNQAYPTFTLIIESENLVSCQPDEIEKMFESLLNQTLPITQANEVILGDNGLIPVHIIQQVTSLIPNLKLISIEREITYYQAKNLMANVATGEVIVFCDSDCVYEPQWLESLIQTFVNKDNTQAVAGETVIDVKGFFSLAIAVNYMLHRQENSSEPKPCKFYYLNNVAFDRQFFVEHPLPSHLKIFRGTCSVHSKELIQQGTTIWKVFTAKAYHLPPQNFKYYLLRFLIMGHDNYWLDRFVFGIGSESQIPSVALVKDEPASEPALVGEQTLPALQSQSKAKVKRKSVSLYQRVQRRYVYWLNQLKIYSEEYPLKPYDIWLALPIVLFSQSLVMLGRLITQFNGLFSKEPHWLYHLTKLLD